MRPTMTGRLTLILRVRRRDDHDRGIHRKLPVIAPFDFLVPSDPLDQPDAAAAGQEKVLREPQFGIHLGLFENHLGAGIEARQEQAPGDGIGGLLFAARALAPGRGAPETTQTDRPSTVESPSNRRSNSSGISERKANSRRRRVPASSSRRCFSADVSELSRRVSLSSFFCSLRCSSGLSGLPSRSSVRRYGCPSSISVSQASRFVDSTLPRESRCVATECACQV